MISNLCHANRLPYRTENIGPAIQLLEHKQTDRQADRRTARLKTLYCAPSWLELITNMQNEHPKCTSVQNHIANLDLHVPFQPQKSYTMRSCP